MQLRRTYKKGIKSLEKSLHKQNCMFGGDIGGYMEGVRKVDATNKTPQISVARSSTLEGEEGA